MWRGTTPTHVFTLPDEFADTAFETVFVTYSQNGSAVLEKTASDLTREENRLTLSLSQEDTLRFSEGAVKIQLRVKTAAGQALASSIISITASELLKDGVI